MTSKMIASLLPLALLGVFGCEEGTKCQVPECPEGAVCYCDDQGRLFRELRDANGDGIGDEIRHTRDAAGRVVQITSDWGANGSVERMQHYTYDDQNHRVAYDGWTQQCADKKFKWSCRYETPCPAPYDKCAPCKKKYEYENKDGTITPCGKPGAGAAK